MALDWSLLQSFIAVAGEGSLSGAARALGGSQQTMVIAGGPRTVTEKLHAFREEIGGFGTLIATVHDWDEEARWRRSMALLANHVVPHL